MKRRTDARKGKPKKKKAFGGRRAKFCKFCVEKSLMIDYKDVKTLQAFTPEQQRDLLAYLMSEAGVKAGK